MNKKEKYSCKNFVNLPNHLEFWSIMKIRRKISAKIID